MTPNDSAASISQRPPLEERCFSSDAIEDAIAEVGRFLRDPELA